MFLCLREKTPGDEADKVIVFLSEVGERVGEAGLKGWEAGRGRQEVMC